MKFGINFTSVVVRMAKIARGEAECNLPFSGLKLGHKLLYEGGKKKKRGGKGGKRRGEEKRLIFAMDNDVFPLNFVKQKYYRT